MEERSFETVQTRDSTHMDGNVVKVVEPTQCGSGDVLGWSHDH